MPDSRPTSSPDRAGEARAVLIEGLAHLLDEVALLRGIVGRIPEAILDGRPLEEDLTIRELYALIAAADARIYLPAVERLADGAEGAGDVPDERALLETQDLEGSIDALLDTVADARRALVAAFEALPEAAWHRRVALGDEVYDGYGLAHHAVGGTAERLRAVGYRLHESNMTDRPQGLPK